MFHTKHQDFSQLYNLTREKHPPHHHPLRSDQTSQHHISFSSLYWTKLDLQKKAETISYKLIIIEIALFTNT